LIQKYTQQGKVKINFFNNKIHCFSDQIRIDKFAVYSGPHQSLVGKTPTEIYWGKEVVKKAAFLIQRNINKKRL